MVRKLLHIRNTRKNSSWGEGAKIVLNEKHSCISYLKATTILSGISEREIYICVLSSRDRITSMYLGHIFTVQTQS